MAARRCRRGSWLGGGLKGGRGQVEQGGELTGGDVDVPPAACTLLPPPADVTEASPSTLSTSPDHQHQQAAVQFGLVRSDGVYSSGGDGRCGGGSEGQLLSEGSGLRPSGFKRSLSMAELSATELVRQEDVGLQSADSSDRPSLAALAAVAAETQAEQQAGAGAASASTQARPAAL